VTPETPPLAARRPRTRRILGWVAAGLVVVLAVTAVGGYLVYRHLSGNITHYDASKHIKIKQPPKLGKAQNILVIGSDTRAFVGGSKYGGEVAGARSDTAILVHLSAGGSKAILVSIPRDSWVRIPPCETSSGTSAPFMSKFNTAYSIGGPACTIATVESLTGIRIDHFVEVNFAGFTTMVNALGGVSVCISQPINDPIRYIAGHYEGSGLVLSAGTHTLKGTQALAFVRARYGVGDGSDIGRIKNQQLFLSSVIRKATSAGLLLDPIALYQFLDAATKSIQTDPGFGLEQLRSLAGKLHGLKPGKVALLTVPIVYSAPGMPSADVAWDPTRAPLLWNALRTDGPLPGTAPAPNPTTSPTAATVPLIVPPGAIHVRVLNGTGRVGVAHQVAQQLAAKGFLIVGIGDADSSGYQQTFVRYGPDRVQSSQTLAASVPGSTRELDGSLGTTLELVVGSNFSGVQSVTLSSAAPQSSATPSPTPTLDVVTAERDVCSSN
jgi:LCP family protein required for cell wall assembly